MIGFIEIILVQLIALAGSVLASWYYYQHRENDPSTAKVFLVPVAVFLGIVLVGTGLLIW
jgi:hypothetical protein